MTSQVYVTTNYFVDSKNQCFLTKMKTICSSKRKLFSVDHQNRVNMHHNPHCKNNSLLILLIKTPCNMSSCTTKKKKKKTSCLKIKCAFTIQQTYLISWSAAFLTTLRLSIHMDKMHHHNQVMDDMISECMSVCACRGKVYVINCVTDAPACFQVVNKTQN